MARKKSERRHRSTPSTFQELCEMISSTGHKIVHTGGGHPRVLRPNGTFLMAIPLTPRHDRSWANQWRRFLRERGRAPRP